MLHTLFGMLHMEQRHLDSSKAAEADPKSACEEDTHAILL